VSAVEATYASSDRTCVRAAAICVPNRTIIAVIKPDRRSCSCFTMGKLLNRVLAGGRERRVHLYPLITYSHRYIPFAHAHRYSFYSARRTHRPTVCVLWTHIQRKGSVQTSKLARSTAEETGKDIPKLSTPHRPADYIHGDVPFGHTYSSTKRMASPLVRLIDRPRSK
jgi:hypothetical protein